MAVTLKDIAERTGVSPSVVSTVLSGRDNGTFVSDSTRRKVIQVAEMLHYTPVRSGRPRGSRRLRRQHTEQFIGVWDADYSPYSAYLVQNLQIALRDYARELGAEAEDDFGLRLLNADDLPRLDSLGLMGLILLSPILLPREAATASIPCVMIGEVDNPPRELIQVHLDNAAAGRLLGEYLWGLGHRRIVLLAPVATPRVTHQRLHGLHSVWTQQGAAAAQIIWQPYDTMKTLGERDQIRRVITSLQRPGSDQASLPTALVCNDENVAAVAGQTLAELGLRVPQQLSVAGFGDTPRLAEALTPPLTVVRQPVPLLAKAAIAALYEAHDAKNLRLSWSATFACRASSSRAPLVLRRLLSEAELMPNNRHPHILRREDTLLVVVDMQEPFLRGIHDRARLTENVRLLVQAAGILHLPVLTTLQYAERMGGLVPEINEVLPDEGTCGPLNKLAFSCTGNAAFINLIDDLGFDAPQILLCGVETHICVSQTALDLVYRGCQVHVAADAVSARSLEKHKLGMERMRDSAVLPCAAEAAVYELLREAGTPEFKEILKLVK